MWKKFQADLWDRCGAVWQVSDKQALRHNDFIVERAVDSEQNLEQRASKDPGFHWWDQWADEEGFSDPAASASNSTQVFEVPGKYRK